jgi:Asp-tRNA(Asn)/Glu-tRNA(Gln) amidotransferase A subunit family amidase
VAANAQTGHPCAVVPYAFDVPASGGPGGGGGGATPQPPLNKQPLCATLIGNLYRDDTILSVAHQFQQATDVHTRRPTLG